MSTYLLFIDASADPVLKIAFGSFLFIKPGSDSLDVKTIKFENSSSSRTELQILLYALNIVVIDKMNLNIYTDSNTIISLDRRKERLFKNHFRSKNNKLLSNHLLYKDFYRLTESLNYKLIKMKGHSSSSLKDSMDINFSLVDRASRKALRKYLKDA